MAIRIDQLPDDGQRFDYLALPCPLPHSRRYVLVRLSQPLMRDWLALQDRLNGICPSLERMVAYPPELRLYEHDCLTVSLYEVAHDLLPWEDQLLFRGIPVGLALTDAEADLTSDTLGYSSSIATVIEEDSVRFVWECGPDAAEMSISLPRAWIIDQVAHPRWTAENESR